MKKSLLALAVLGAFAGVASAQSSVTLFGTVDLNARYVKNDGQVRRVSLSQNGINSSRLGFRGVEDLGSGLKASFVLEGDIQPDTGGQVTPQLWNRRSTVSLMGGFGEVRLGRDYTPTFWTQTIFDVFGTQGVGSATNIRQIATVAGVTHSTFVRANNTIGYHLPSNIGGVYGQFMVSPTEGVQTEKYLGGRVGFAAGPVDVAFAYGQQNLNVNDKLKSYNIGGAYNLGVVKLTGYVNRDTAFTAKDNRISFGVAVPMGQGELHASYNQSKLTNTNYSNKVNQIAAGYVYNLSKRTAMYSNVSRLKNGAGSTLSLPNGAGPTMANGKSTGFEVGVRHFF